MRAVIPIAIVLLVAYALVPRYAAQMKSPPQRRGRGRGASRTCSSAIAFGRDPASRGGHFRVTNAASISCLTTGASVIALKPEDATTLGIRPIASDYVAAVKTANGVIRVAARHRRDRGS